MLSRSPHMLKKIGPITSEVINWTKRRQQDHTMHSGSCSLADCFCQPSGFRQSESFWKQHPTDNLHVLSKWHFFCSCLFLWITGIVLCITSIIIRILELLQYGMLPSATTFIPLNIFLSSFIETKSTVAPLSSTWITSKHLKMTRIFPSLSHSNF